MDFDARRYRLRQRGRPIDAWIAGDGPPLVLLHGWGLSGRVYGSALRALAAAGYRAVAPSAAVVDPPWSLARAAAHVAETIGVVDAHPAPLVGHSFGGSVAVQIATDSPDLATAIVLVGSLMVSPGRRRLARAVVPGPQYRIAGHLSTAASMMGTILARGGASSLAASARWVMNADMSAQLAALRERGTPAAVLWAVRDTLLPAAAGRQAARLLGVRLDVVKASNGWPDRRPPDHDWPLRGPTFFAKRIARTLDHLLAGERGRGGGPGAGGATASEST